MAQQPTKPSSNFVDRPEVPETFADSVELGMFDDGVVRITLAARRWKPSQTGGNPVAETVPTARLVLTTKACVALYNHLNQMMAHLVQSGLVTPDQPPDRPKGNA